MPLMAATSSPSLIRPLDSARLPLAMDPTRVRPGSAEGLFSKIPIDPPNRGGNVTGLVSSSLGLTKLKPPSEPLAGRGASHTSASSDSVAPLVLGILNGCTPAQLASPSANSMLSVKRVMTPDQRGALMSAAWRMSCCTTARPCLPCSSDGFTATTATTLPGDKLFREKLLKP